MISKKRPPDPSVEVRVASAFTTGHSEALPSCTPSSEGVIYLLLRELRALKDTEPLSNDRI